MQGGQENWTPMQVLEYTLRVTGDGLIDGDFDAFASVFDLPHNITTFEGNRLLQTRSDLRETFDTVRMHFDVYGITSIVRECISAEFEGTDRIKAAHTTRLLSGALQIGQTSMAYSILHLKGARWLGVSSQYAMAEKELSASLVVTSGRAQEATSDASETSRETSTTHSRGRKLQ